MVLRYHTTDEFSEVSVRARATGSARDTAPVGAICTVMPRDDGRRFDDYRRSGPVAPYGPQGDPEAGIGRREPRPATALSQAGELLAQCEVLKHQGLSRANLGITGPHEESQDEPHRAETCPISSGWSFGEAQAQSPVLHAPEVKAESSLVKLSGHFHLLTTRPAMADADGEEGAPATGRGPTWSESSPPRRPCIEARIVPRAPV